MKNQICLALSLFLGLQILSPSEVFADSGSGKHYRPGGVVYGSYPPPMRKPLRDHYYRSPTHYSEYSRPNYSWDRRPYFNPPGSWAHRPVNYEGRSNGPRERFDREIQQGISSGRLSNAEVRELRQKEAELARRYQNYRYDDGRLDRRERESLKDKYADLRGDLNHELNDGERRREWDWR